MTDIQLIKVKTKRLEPPKDDLYTALNAALPQLKNGDVLCISAKVVAIHEGRCIKHENATDKDALVKKETKWWLPREMNPYGFMLTIIHNALIASAGIDESNSGDYFTLLPKNPTQSAKAIQQYFSKKYSISDLAVIITDSHTTPLRWGTQGIAIGAFGLKPLRDYRGSADLFNREIQSSQHNIIDTLATTAVSLMGEGAEQTPAIVIRNWPDINFTQEDTWEDLVINPEKDVFWPLLKIFKPQKY